MKLKQGVGVAAAVAALAGGASGLRLRRAAVRAAVALPAGLSQGAIPYHEQPGFNMDHHERLLGEEKLDVVEIPPGYDLLEDFDWALNSSVVTPGRNQGGCGSCWAFAAVGAVEAQVAINTGLTPKFGGEGDFRLSEQQLLDCAGNPNKCGGTGGCEGSTQGLGLSYFAKEGFDLLQDGKDDALDQYQQSDQKCATTSTKADRPGQLDGWAQVADNDLESLMFAIREFGPVTVAVDAGGFSGYNGGILAHEQCGSTLNHAVLAVGYGCDSKDANGDASDCWIKIRNSWGNSWGECADHTKPCADDGKGFIRIARQSLKERREKANEVCHMDLSTADGLGCKGLLGDIKPRNTMVCGTCGVLYKPTLPIGAKLAQGATAGAAAAAGAPAGDDPVAAACKAQGKRMECSALGCKCV